MHYSPLFVTAYTLTNALGFGVNSAFEALEARRSGLRRCDFEPALLDTWIGRVDGIEDQPVSEALSDFDCRNNRLAQIGLKQDGFEEAVDGAKERYGADRIGVFMGTSTSGIGETEIAYRNKDGESGRLPSDYRFSTTHNPFSLALFTSRFLGLTGAAAVVSTACSSSAKVFAMAYRHIQSGICDAAVVGGVDSLCLTTLYGFNSLELLAPGCCKPWDKRREGISIGEGAGFMLLEKSAEFGRGLALLGYGESCDAYHMSAPHPEGLGAALAMQRGLTSAGITLIQVDYLNLHGTATRANDASEDKAVTAVLGPQASCSSTKGWTGHTLGASGVTESIFCCLSIEHGFLPGTLNTEQRDPELNISVLLENRISPVRVAVNNSFGFGGNNCSLVFGEYP